jgi:hypothetical protein
MIICYVFNSWYLSIRDIWYINHEPSGSSDDIFEDKIRQILREEMAQIPFKIDIPDRLDER